MANKIFTNTRILDWLQYFTENTDVDLEKVKMLDISGRNKNLIPTVESNRAVMAFTDDNNPDIFYKMWEVGLGECDVWYNEGSEPVGPMKHDKLKDMIDRGISASAGMLVLNPNARSSYKIGMDISDFSKGSMHFVGSEIRTIILSKLEIDPQDNICIIGGASIAIEAALMANMGTVVAVEYSKDDREIMEENIYRFGLNNVVVTDKVDEKTFIDLPAPKATFLVASASTENEIKYLLKVNPEMEFIIYTLDFKAANNLQETLEEAAPGKTDVIQIAVSHLDAKHMFETEPAPWLLVNRK